MWQCHLPLPRDHALHKDRGMEDSRPLGGWVAGDRAACGLSFILKLGGRVRRKEEGEGGRERGAEGGGRRAGRELQTPTEHQHPLPAGGEGVSLSPPPSHGVRNLYTRGGKCPQQPQHCPNPGMSWWGRSGLPGQGARLGCRRPPWCGWAGGVHLCKQGIAHPRGIPLIPR